MLAVQGVQDIPEAVTEEVSEPEVESFPPLWPAQPIQHGRHTAHAWVEIVVPAQPLPYHRIMSCSYDNQTIFWRSKQLACKKIFYWNVFLRKLIFLFSIFFNKYPACSLDHDYYQSLKGEMSIEWSDKILQNLLLQIRGVQIFWDFVFFFRLL